MMHKMHQEEVAEFKRIMLENVDISLSTQKLKEQTEASIKMLEEQEIQMLSKMQATLARKQAATQKLETKSKALLKGIEPRGAYKLE